MKYSELTQALQKQTGMNEEQARSVLSSLPKVLGELDENEQVRTSLGTFAAWPKKEKAIKLPDGRTVLRKEEVVVRLRPGQALKRTKK